MSSELQKKLDEANHKLKQYEDSICLSPWAISSMNISLSHPGAYGEQTVMGRMDLRLSEREAESIMNMMRDKGKMDYQTVPLKQPVSHRIELDPKSITSWEANQSTASEYVELTIKARLRANTFKYNLLPGLGEEREVKETALEKVKTLSVEELQELMGIPVRTADWLSPGQVMVITEPERVITAGRAVGKSTSPGIPLEEMRCAHGVKVTGPLNCSMCTIMESTPPSKSEQGWWDKMEEAFGDAPLMPIVPVPMNESPAARDYTAMEDAVIVLRAKLLETYLECLVDDLLLQPLRDVIGEDWFEMLVNNTDKVLETEVRMIPK